MKGKSPENRPENNPKNQKKRQKNNIGIIVFSPENRSVIFVDSFASKTNRLPRYASSLTSLALVPCARSSRAVIAKKKGKMSRNNHKSRRTGKKLEGLAKVRQREPDKVQNQE